MAGTYIILVNWNGHRDTIECLESLLRLETDDFAVVIVDNGSADGSVDAIAGWAEGEAEHRVGPIWDGLPPARRHAPGLRVVSLRAEPEPVPDGARITLIAAGANLGFAAANNVGARFASRDRDARFYWILNNDTVARPDALAQLLLHAGIHSGQGIIGSTLLYYHAPETVQGLGGWIWPGRAIGGHIGFGLKADALPSQAEVEKKLAYVMGASMFIRREVYDAIGGMQEDYFLYFEEPDLAKRLPAGVGQGICLGAMVYHKEGGSIGTDSIGRTSDTSLYYFTVNTLRYFWRHERLFMPVALGRVAWNLLLAARRGDRAAVRVMARAFADAVLQRPRRGPFGSAEFVAAGKEPRERSALLRPASDAREQGPLDQPVE